MDLNRLRQSDIMSIVAFRILEPLGNIEFLEGKVNNRKVSTTITSNCFTLEMGSFMENYLG